MYFLRFFTVFFVLASGVAAQEAAPDWSRRTFSAPADRVFAAAIKSVAEQHHEVKSKDEVNRVLTFHVGVTAWSWGYNMVLKVTSAETGSSTVSIEIVRSGGKAVSWGSGKKEVQKIFKGMEKDLSKAPPAAQGVTKEAVEGVTNFKRLDTTVACAGATTAQAVPEIKKMGFASIINLRQASEPGAEIEAEAEAAKAAGIRYYHIPFDHAAPDPAAVDKFLEAISAKDSEPSFVHCASGSRAATMWFIKRMVVDHWDAERAEKEAAALGMTNPALKQFALDYARAHKR